MIKSHQYHIQEKRIALLSKRWLKNHGSGKEYLKLFKLAASFNYAIVKDFSHKETDDELTIKYLGSRLFNFGIISYRSLVSGYYQVGFSLIREFLETHFLIDYFRTNKKEIQRWKNVGNGVKKTDFYPSNLYNKLDDRDQFMGEERKKQYQLFCEYALHPTYKGLTLLTNSENLIETGFFFDDKKLLSGMFELAKRYSVVSLSLSPLLRTNSIETINCHIKLLIQFQKLFGTSKTKVSAGKLIKLLKKKKKVIEEK